MERTGGLTGFELESKNHCFDGSRSRARTPMVVAAHHSQKRAAFSGLETGPVKGTSF